MEPMLSVRRVGSERARTASNPRLDNLFEISSLEDFIPCIRSCEISSGSQLNQFLRRFVHPDVIGRNLRVLDHVAEALRTKRREPNLETVFSLAIFYHVLVDTLELDRGKSSADIAAVLKSLIPSTDLPRSLSVEEVCGSLTREKFLVPDLTASNIRLRRRQIGGLAEFSKYLLPPVTRENTGPYTRFSTFSRMSAW